MVLAKIMETARMFQMTRNDARVIEAVRIANIALTDGLSPTVAYEIARLVLCDPEADVSAPLPAQNLLAAA